MIMVTMTTVVMITIVMIQSSNTFSSVSVGCKTLTHMCHYYSMTDTGTKCKSHLVSTTALVVMTTMTLILYN